MKPAKKRLVAHLGAMAGAMAVSVPSLFGSVYVPQPGWVTGDFHQHSTYTDGSYSISRVLQSNVDFGLDWWANSEHGGGFNRDGRFSGNDLGTTVYWDSYTPNPILGTVSSSGGHRNMWRWQSIRDFSFLDVLDARQHYPQKTVFQAFEWNVPGHEHCSVGIIGNQFQSNPDVVDVAAFEYMFDNGDADTIGGAAQGWTKSVLSGHAKAVQAVSWLGANHPNDSWVVFAHPERKSQNSIGAFRDFNNAAPTVAFGFESMPGHQRSNNRGEYGNGTPGQNNSVGGGTFGGCGAYAAQIGGLWDAMLGEGRAWWLFASSDFHNDAGADYWPGEYQKTHTYVSDRNDPQAILDGLRSGNSFVVEGDLIDGLDFTVQAPPPGQNLWRKATMGETLNGRPGKMAVVVRFHSPDMNNNGDVPVLDHIDIIQGDVTGLVPPADPNYNVPSNPSAKKVATIANVQQLPVDAQGWRTAKVFLTVTKDSYFRLRGTNQPYGVDNADIYANGDPKRDDANPLTGDAEAWTDLWFYSNPVFVNVP